MILFKNLPWSCVRVLEDTFDLLNLEGCEIFLFGFGEYCVMCTLLLTVLQPRASILFPLCRFSLALSQSVSLCRALVMRLSIAIQLVKFSPITDPITQSNPGKAIQASPWPPDSCLQEQ